MKYETLLHYSLLFYKCDYKAWLFSSFIIHHWNYKVVAWWENHRINNQLLTNVRSGFSHLARMRLNSIANYRELYAIVTVYHSWNFSFYRAILDITYSITSLHTKYRKLSALFIFTYCNTHRFINIYLFFLFIGWD